jgi:ATP synthase F1 complex assembly factor 2
MILPRAALPSQLPAVARHPVSLYRRIHSSPFRSAVAHPVTAHGPPPKAPDASPEFKEPAGLNPQESDIESKRTPKLTAALKKRFWKDVHVNGKSGMSILAGSLSLLV